VALRVAPLRHNCNTARETFLAVRNLDKGYTTLNTWSEPRNRPVPWSGIVGYAFNAARNKLRLVSK